MQILELVNEASCKTFEDLYFWPFETGGKMLFCLLYFCTKAFKTFFSQEKQTELTA
jgi:hypothetical protein